MGKAKNIFRKNLFTVFTIFQFFAFCCTLGNREEELDHQSSQPYTTAEITNCIIGLEDLKSSIVYDIRIFDEFKNLKDQASKGIVKDIHKNERYKKKVIGIWHTYLNFVKKCEPKETRKINQKAEIMRHYVIHAEGMFKRVIEQEETMSNDNYEVKNGFFDFTSETERIFEVLK